MRARLGYAGWNNWLPYLTGGGAFGDVKADDRSALRQQDPAAAGPPALGLEYAFLANWSVKVEYLYVDLGKFDCGTTCGAVTPTT